MLFVEFAFFPFFLAVFVVHWALPRHGWRKLWLLAASYFFYAAWDWRFLLLIVTSTVVDYVAGLKIPGSPHRRLWLLLSLGVNLGLLGFFKYFNFFLDSAVDLLVFLGFEPNVPTLRILLPIGISFYTFQTLSYSIDIYRGSLAPTRNLLDLSLFVAFFPQLVAGPIMRAADFLPQLRQRTVFARADVRGALILFLIGFAKKACVSDNLAVYVDRYYAAPLDFDVLSAWAAGLSYAIQVYCDFSGYSDMAIACAALLGYRLCVNFNHPYLSPDVGAFWRRWHISLSFWLRDYVYISLGGNRRSEARTHFNLITTFLISGLWHGAGWNFIIFGGLHGVAMSVHRLWKRHVQESSLARRLVSPVSVLLTFLFFTFSLIFFRAQTLGDAVTTVRAFLLFQSAGSETLPLDLFAVFALLAVVHWLFYRRPYAGWWRRGSDWAFACGLAGVVAITLSFVRFNAQPFIYFQF